MVLVGDVELPPDGPVLVVVVEPDPEVVVPAVPPVG